MALRLQLQAALQVMLIGELCSAAEVRAFLRELDASRSSIRATDLSQPMPG